MRDLLRNGSHVRPPEQDVQYTILERIGSGSSCVVYRAERFDFGHEREIHLLKEYAPSEFTVRRAPDGSMTPADDVRDAYQSGMKRFLTGAKHAAFLRSRSELRDSICEILQAFPANGTCYLDMPVSEGIVYAGVRELSLDSLLRRVSALTLVVGRIHQTGLLCLDLKPGNLLIRPENPDYIMLFDLDSAISRETLLQGGGLRYSQAWAPPEQKLPSLYGDICEASDLYAIGEMLFYQLWGRHSRPEERRPSATLDFSAAPLLDGMEAETLRVLNKVLCRAVSACPERRYQRADELLEAVEELLAMSDREHAWGEAALRPTLQRRSRDGSFLNPKKDNFLSNLTYASIDSGDYEPLRKSARLRRARAKTRFGRESQEYLDAAFHDAAACFAELAASLEDNTIPPSPLTDEFLWILAEYLAVAETVPAGREPRRGSLTAFADGLRQTAFLRRSEGMLSGENRALLDMAAQLARFAGDAETLAELRETACPREPDSVVPSAP